jgi:hypothetical protein
MATKRNTLTIRVPEDLKKGVDKKTMLNEVDRILASVPERENPNWDTLGNAGE